MLRASEPIAFPHEIILTSARRLEFSKAHRCRRVRKGRFIFGCWFQLTCGLRVALDVRVARQASSSVPGAAEDVVSILVSGVLRWEFNGKRGHRKFRMIGKKTDLLLLTHSNGIIFIRLLTLGESVTAIIGGLAFRVFYEHATLSDFLTLGRL